MGYTIAILGGGIAGVSCLEILIREFKLGKSLYDKIILISENGVIKRIKNLKLRGRNLETFDVFETNFQDTEDLDVPDGLDLRFVEGAVDRVDVEERTVLVRNKKTQPSQNTCEIHYDILSICIGARPKPLKVDGSDRPFVQEHMLTIRDTASVSSLREQLATCRRIAIVGNGGISLGLVDKITGCEKIWITQGDYIGGPFLDSGASKFLLDSIGLETQKTSIDQRGWQQDPKQSSKTLPITYSFGPALGPNWLQQLNLYGIGESNLELIYRTQVESIRESYPEKGPLLIGLADGQEVECDLLVTAIGVVPNHVMFSGARIETSDIDGGIIIDEEMRTSIKGIYAAGDVVSCEKWRRNKLWFQMRLWTQARQMGAYCGRCIIAHLERTDPSIYFTFDCFTHCTEFFGKKVVLIGRYNGQGLDEEDARKLEIVARVQPGHDYVRLTLESGVVISAILIGDSDLEETIENLINDQIDVSHIKDQLLDNTVDIEDYFD